MVWKRHSVLVMFPTATATKHLLFSESIHESIRMSSFDNLEKELFDGANEKYSNKMS